MGYKSKEFGAPLEIDMTPMIDMTFQLIAFFMFTLNFANSEVNEVIRLPLSDMAKPPDAPHEKPLTLQVGVHRNNDVVLDRPPYVIYNGQEISIDEMKGHLIKEKEFLVRQKIDPKLTTIIIRADKDVRTGEVQRLIRNCQEAGFEKFVLRAKEDVKT